MAVAQNSNGVKPLRERPLDFAYFLFFALHIPATLLIDLQALYPQSLVPGIIAQLPKFYISMSKDPLISGAFSGSDAFIWFRTFLTLEAIFQLPVFVLGMRGLLRGSRAIYVLLLIYGASTATTTLPCIAVVFTTPITSAETVAANIASISAEQRLLLLTSYIPFFLMPLLITVDMASRVLTLVREGERVSKAAKSR
ncbi:transmembrane protein 6/97 [Irpex rosettiformis]|uniref:Transmembrane protein 6/97 n=1 Tax=Irpex rosettiformis TaxID=378272 RepID=A0ACB8TPA5_9APHY|nr:transmembrane protein 6/97 [Irpex rosettiformis]